MLAYQYIGVTKSTKIPQPPKLCYAKICYTNLMIQQIMLLRVFSTCVIASQSYGITGLEFMKTDPHIHGRRLGSVQNI